MCGKVWFWIEFLASQYPELLTCLATQNYMTIRVDIVLLISWELIWWQLILWELISWKEIHSVYQALLCFLRTLGTRLNTHIDSHSSTPSHHTPTHSHKYLCIHITGTYCTCVLQETRVDESLSRELQLVQSFHVNFFCYQYIFSATQKFLALWWYHLMNCSSCVHDVFWTFFL